jgi:aryl-alcohol dehydrogenase-like predicted oxidoreductase
VSEVALGTMQFGGKMNMGNLGQEETTRMVKLAVDRGINFIDTAAVYRLRDSWGLPKPSGIAVWICTTSGYRRTASRTRTRTISRRPAIGPNRRG